MTYGTAHPHPYILFGPPGTGKTVTLVEAIKQVWRTDQRSRIIVAAPSNTAADLLASRLFPEVPENQVLRLVSRSWMEEMMEKKKKELPPAYRYEPDFMRRLANSKMVKENVVALQCDIARAERKISKPIPPEVPAFPDGYVKSFEFEGFEGGDEGGAKNPMSSDWEVIEPVVRLRPAAKLIMEYRVVVVTLCKAGSLVSEGVPEGFFTHVFIDEAGQATEPECLIPMTMLGPEGHLVLAGDPHQVGSCLDS